MATTSPATAFAGSALVVVKLTLLTTAGVLSIIDAGDGPAAAVRLPAASLAIPAFTLRETVPSPVIPSTLIPVVCSKVP